MSRMLVAVSMLCLVACTDQNDLSDPERSADASADTVSSTELSLDASASRGAHTALSGGATTVFDSSVGAFGFAAPNLAGLNLARHESGDAQFELEFGEDPAGPSPGLGPVFDNVSCEACHVGDGRGRPPIPGDGFGSLLYRASVAGRDSRGGPKPVPGLGGQLQLQAITGFNPDAVATITYTPVIGSFTDNTPFELRAPSYSLTGGGGLALPAGILISPRVAPVVFGLGLLEAVPDREVLLLADPRDRNRDGISGRPNLVWNEVRRRLSLGRFGWKAGAPTLLQQTAGAYNGDMGITSTIFPAESCAGQPGCGPHAIEVSDQTVQDVALYTQTLGVPARRNLNDAAASQGEQLFYVAGCAGCHMPTLRTGSLPGVPEVSNQVIHPYTDLLLHDMGPGLADDRPDFQASGQEWRTPPLWGIGLLQTVNGHTNLLHDGRARNLLEAVLWHGGEGTSARERVRAFSAADRAALVAFLASL